MPRMLSAEQRPEGRPRFEALVPALDGGEIRPRHIAQIVEAREMRRRRQIGEREIIARQPVAAGRSSAPI